MNRLERINELLRASFKVGHIDVIDESSGHAVPAGAESHFKVVLSSEDFVDMPKVRRHQRVYQALANELESGLHALALHLYTPEEWRTLLSAPESPKCMGSK